MEMRYPPHLEEVKRFTTEEIRRTFLIQNLFADDKINMVYSHIDRIITGGVCPVHNTLDLTADPKELGADYFLQRREIGIINIGGAGQVAVNGTTYDIQRLDGLYIGMGTPNVRFSSVDPAQPARFYFNSTPAHATYPVSHISFSAAAPVHLGDNRNSNKRTIYKFIHPDGVKSCQLVMGMTLLEPNNMWNTMPAHTHARRMEVYFYFDLEGDNVVFHLMGEPQETRHLVVRNEQVVISPSWSIHSGMGTGNYTFIWAMAGENQTFSDMDAIAMGDLL